MLNSFSVIKYSDNIPSYLWIKRSIQRTNGLQIGKQSVMFCSANLAPTQNTPIKMKINRINQPIEFPFPRHHSSSYTVHMLLWEGYSDTTAKEVKLV